ncbi:MAG: ABC transporter ATP-binding protein [Anaerolineae bacterium]
MALLVVEDLYLYYADRGGVVHAVDGLSFTLVRPGEAFGIVGESGSGKTSLALALMRLLPVNIARFQGRILLAGEDITRLPEEQFRRQVRWRRMALVPQGAMNALNPVLRVGEQIVEPLLVGGHADRRTARHRAEELLQLVGLPAQTYDRFAHELSGGMKQRVMIAASLILSPRLVLMDEPTSALDVSVQAQITNLLKRLKRELQLSILFITHDIALASDVCDSLAVMYAGELVETGSAEQVLTAPAHPYSQKLLSAVPRLHSQDLPQFVPGAPPDLHCPPAGCRFHPRCPYAMDVCRLEAPPPLSPIAGHKARCWLLKGTC